MIIRVFVMCSYFFRIILYLKYYINFDTYFFYSYNINIFIYPYDILIIFLSYNRFISNITALVKIASTQLASFSFRDSSCLFIFTIRKKEKKQIGMIPEICYCCFFGVWFKPDFSPNNLKTFFMILILNEESPSTSLYKTTLSPTRSLLSLTNRRQPLETTCRFWMEIFLPSWATKLPLLPCFVLHFKISSTMSFIQLEYPQNLGWNCQPMLYICWREPLRTAPSLLPIYKLFNKDFCQK